MAKLPKAELYKVYSPDQYDLPLIVVTRNEEQSRFDLTTPVLATEQPNLPLNPMRRKRLGVSSHPSTFEWQLFKGDLHLADHIAWVAVQLLGTVYEVLAPIHATGRGRASWPTRWSRRWRRSRPSSTREVALLNRDAQVGRYYLEDGWLIAEVRLLANPFVPQHPMDTLDGLLDETHAIAEDFAWRTHGKVLDA